MNIHTLLLPGASPLSNLTEACGQLAAEVRDRRGVKTGPVPAASFVAHFAKWFVRNQPLISLRPLLWAFVTVSPIVPSRRRQVGHEWPDSIADGSFVSLKVAAWAPGVAPEAELESRQEVQPQARELRMPAPVRCQKHRPPRNHSWQEPRLSCQWSGARLRRRKLC